LGAPEPELLVEKEVEKDFLVAPVHNVVERTIQLFGRELKGPEIEDLREIEGDHGDASTQGLPELLEGFQVVSVRSVALFVAFLEDTPRSVGYHLRVSSSCLLVFSNRLLGKNRTDLELPHSLEVAWGCVAKAVACAKGEWNMAQGHRPGEREQLHQAPGVLQRKVAEFESWSARKDLPAKRIFNEFFPLPDDGQSFSFGATDENVMEGSSPSKRVRVDLQKLKRELL
jgi:hypothetical protein